MTRHEREVLGVVKPPGATASHDSGQRLWSVGLTLQPWKYTGGPLQERELIVVKRVRESSVNEYLQRLSDDAVVRLRLRVADDAADRAELLDVVSTEERDEELHAALAELRKPVTREDAYFGTFTFDRGLDWWTAEWSGGGSPVQVSVSTEGDVEAAIAAARAICQSPTLLPRAPDYAAAQLLALKNDTWLEEDEEPVTAEEFSERMTLESIVIDGEGEYTLYYQDGDLFWGHSILVTGNLAAEFSQASIAG